MPTYAELITKADIAQADLDILTQIELEPTALYTHVDNNDGTVDFTDGTTIHTAGHVSPSVAASQWRWKVWDADGVLIASISSTSQNPTLTFTYSGTYTVELLVTTNYGWNDSITKSISVELSPTAAFTYSVTPFQGGAAVTIHQTSTADSGSIITQWVYDWADAQPDTTKTDGSDTPHHYVVTSVPYSVRLTVTTDLGQTHFVNVNVTWTPVSEGTVAGWGFQQTDDYTVVFTDASTDADGTIAVRAWDFGDGGVSSATNPTHVYDNEGIYVVTLEVWDNDGNYSSLTKPVTIERGATLPPVAGFTWSQALKVLTAADVSVAGTNSIVQWSWSWGDGTFEVSSIGGLSHTYANYGVYDVILTVVDNTGLSDSITNSVDLVDPVGDTAPTAAFNVTGSLPSMLRTFNDSSSGGTYSITRWDIQWGKDELILTFAVDPTGQTHTYLDSGIYTIKLWVYDSAGLTDFHSIVVDLTFSPTYVVTAAFTIDSCTIETV